MKTICLLLGALLVASPGVHAQDAAFHAQLRDRLDIPGAVFADCWGLGDRAYAARFGQATFDIIDMSNPDALNLLRTKDVASPNNTASVQDIKAVRSVLRPARTLVFVSLDAGSPDGVQIYDASFGANPALLTNVDVTPGSYSTTHNISVRDDGWLVLCNSFTASLALVDLTNYDPLAAPSAITSWDYQLTGLGTGFVHDITITDDYLFVSQWNSLLVYDVSNLGFSAPSFVAEVQGLSSHAVWATPDSRFVVTTEERQGGAIRLYELDDSGPGFVLHQTDSFVNPANGPGASFSAHNPVVLDDRIYVSNYSAGTIVLQIDRTTGRFEKVASFDTSTQAATGFEGAWGVYPLNGHDRVIISDLDNGVYTVDFSALQFVSESARPASLLPYMETPISVTINELGSITLDPVSVTLRVSSNDAAFISVPMSAAGGGVWQANLPAGVCGDKLEYFFRAADMGGEVFRFPAAAPGLAHETYVTDSLAPVLIDNFNANQGWTVSNAASLTTGAWERGAPVETSLQPGVDSRGDAGNSCYMTENGPVGGSGSATDLDGGPTNLLSPLLDFGAGDGVVSYSRWLFNNNAETVDNLLVQIRTNDAAPWVTVEDVSLLAGGWIDHRFRVSDYVLPSANVRVRFSAQDNPNTSLTDMGLDDFRAELFCDSLILASASLVNGTGVNPLCLSSQAPVIAQNWSSTIDHSVRASATFTIMVVQAVGSSGVILSGGELLVDLNSPRYITDTLPATGSNNVHSLAVPNDATLAGLSARAQGVVLGGGFSLCNAFDVILGY